MFEVLEETESWGRQLEVPTVGALDDVICEGKASELILMQEALMERRSVISRSRSQAGRIRGLL